MIERFLRGLSLGLLIGAALIGLLRLRADRRRPRHTTPPDG